MGSAMKRSGAQGDGCRFSSPGLIDELETTLRRKFSYDARSSAASEGQAVADAAASEAAAASHYGGSGVPFTVWLARQREAVWR